MTSSVHALDPESVRAWAGQGIAAGLDVLLAEAAALGNVLVQARALGTGPADLAGMRTLIRATQPLRRFEPEGNAALWAAAAGRVGAGLSRD